MYWWIGSAMSPRPSYVSAAPFMPTRVPCSARGGAIEDVTIYRAHGDDPLRVAAQHGHLDRVSRAAAPQPLVELLLGRHPNAVHADDAIAAAEPGRPRGPGVVEAVDDDALAAGGRVQAQPRSGPTTRHASGGDQLVLDRHEGLERDGEVDVRRVAEAERDDADQTSLLVHERAAAPRRDRRRHEECAVEHVLPRRREAPHRLDRARRVHE